MIALSGLFLSCRTILIAVLFGSLFLGNKTKASFKQMFNRVGETFLVNCAAEVFQFGFFMLIGVAVLPKIFKGMHDGFGLMLPLGFVGGHGTAAATGGVFAENGWAGRQGRCHGQESFRRTAAEGCDCKSNGYEPGSDPF